MMAMLVCLVRLRTALIAVTRLCARRQRSHTEKNHRKKSKSFEVHGYLRFFDEGWFAPIRNSCGRREDITDATSVTKGHIDNHETAPAGECAPRKRNLGGSFDFKGRRVRLQA